MSKKPKAMILKHEAIYSATQDTYISIWLMANKADTGELPSFYVSQGTDGHEKRFDCIEDAIQSYNNLCIEIQDQK